MKPSRVLAIPALAIMLSACGAPYVDNESKEKCGETVCVSIPEFTCRIQARWMSISFTMRAQGHRRASYTISGAPNSAGLNGSYTVTDLAPQPHFGEMQGEGGIFNSVIIDVKEGNVSVRRMELDPDDLCR